MAEYAVLTVDQGTDTVFQIEVTDKDGAAKDLTNLSVFGKYKESYGSTTANSFQITTPTPKTSGIIELTLSGDSSISLYNAQRRYVYDVELKNQSDIVERILEGVLEINPGVTLSDSA